MNTEVFDGIAREMGEISTRRNFFRLLGGAAALSAGLALTTRDESLGQEPRQEQGQGGARDRSRPRQGQKITICYQSQTRTVKKSELGQVSRAPRAAPARWPGWRAAAGGLHHLVLSGGPNPSDPITVDDDGSILNVTTGKFLLIDNNGQASSLVRSSPLARWATLLRVRATDYGGCRSFSPSGCTVRRPGRARRCFRATVATAVHQPRQVDYLDITFPMEL